MGSIAELDAALARHGGAITTQQNTVAVQAASQAAALQAQIGWLNAEVARLQAEIDAGGGAASADLSRQIAEVERLTARLREIQVGAVTDFPAPEGPEDTEGPDLDEDGDDDSPPFDLDFEDTIS